MISVLATGAGVLSSLGAAGQALPIPGTQAGASVTGPIPTSTADYRLADYPEIVPPLAQSEATLAFAAPLVIGTGSLRRGLTASPTGANDIPLTALDAYQRAASILRGVSPRCGLDWTLLAGIGRVESNHGRYGGAILKTDGVAAPAIIGVPLNGQGSVAKVPDTDNGRLDHDTTWDRAVGPMQMIPSTWTLAGVDGDGDGVRSPNDIYDASLAAAVYLCAGSSSLDQPANMRAALLRYNASSSYAALVMAYQRLYRTTGLSVLAGPPGASGFVQTQAVVQDAKAVVSKVGDKPTRIKAVARKPLAAASAPGAQAKQSASGKTSPAAKQPAGKPDAKTSQPASGPSSGSSSGPATKPAGDPAPQTTPDPGSSQTPGSTSSPTPDPTPTSSGPGPSPTPDPTPTSSGPSPTPDPAPVTTSPSPTPDPTPAPVTETGTWEQCGDGYCLSGNPLDVSQVQDPASLVGTTVTATVLKQATVWVVLSVS